MQYVVGIAAGLVYGGGVGLLKYVILWRKIIKDKDKTVGMSMVTKRLIASSVINVVTMVLTLVFRHSQTLDFASFAIATAFSLSMVGRIFSVQKALKEKGIEE